MEPTTVSMKANDTIGTKSVVPKKAMTPRRKTETSPSAANAITVAGTMSILETAVGNWRRTNTFAQTPGSKSAQRRKPSLPTGEGLTQLGQLDQSEPMSCSLKSSTPVSGPELDLTRMMMTSQPQVITWPRATIWTNSGNPHAFNRSKKVEATASMASKRLRRANYTFLERVKATAPLT
jgi:hypothetical protein